MWPIVVLTAEALAWECDLEEAGREAGGVDGDGAAWREPARHPLIIELRQARQQSKDLLGALLLSPRSRSASRITERMRGEAANHGLRIHEGDDAAQRKARFLHGPATPASVIRGGRQGE